MNRPRSGVPSYKKGNDWAHSPLISRTLTVYDRPENQKREEERRSRKRPKKNFVLGISTTSRNSNHSDESKEARRYRIRSDSFNDLQPFMERKMVERRNTDASLFKIIFHRFVGTITILITFISIIIFIQNFAGVDSGDQALEKCDILEKLAIRKSRRKSNVETLSRHASLGKFVGTIKTLSIYDR